MDHRADRMKALIIQTFFTCLEKEDFSQLTVGKIAGQALINRSTFYRYFADKYQLRDEVVDNLISDVTASMEVDFLHMDVKNEQHTQSLKNCLTHLRTKKRELEILWNQQLLGRNVFGEIIDAGAQKVEAEIRLHPTISPEKKEYADWYARLLVNNFLVTVRWWFSRKDDISPEQITVMMKRHMISGTIPTLKDETPMF